jgi:ABC-type multidrug transport system fused ATPase/permease subunit
MNLPEGYDTRVGEFGVKLSGGQRQRIAIARAVLKNADILILDEAMAGLDSEAENLVRQALFNLMEDRTTFVITHDFSTIQHAHQIILLANGRIVQKGTHDELINQPGEYASLYQQQFQGVTSSDNGRPEPTETGNEE